MELTETGKALKVQSERPHLVSLGGSRVSTAITLLPLPEGEYLQTWMKITSFAEFFIILFISHHHLSDDLSQHIYLLCCPVTHQSLNVHNEDEQR